MKFTIQQIDHIQVAAPTGSEPEAIRFYRDILGMQEIEKPEPLKSRGGAWFQFGNYQLHVGIEDPFTPARKAHPAFKVTGYDALRAQLQQNGHPVTPDDSIPGVERFYTTDPFGNRLEFIK